VGERLMALQKDLSPAFFTGTMKKKMNSDAKQRRFVHFFLYFQDGPRSFDFR
jgi:hypothetical protein